MFKKPKFYTPPFPRIMNRILLCVCPRGYSFVAVTFLIILNQLLFTSCLTQKIELEFQQKKATVLLLIKPTKFVEKTKGINLLFTEYLQKAPADTVLLNIFTTYLQYQLDRYGYGSQTLYKTGDDISSLEKNQLSYSINLNELKIKEFKRRDTEKDEASGTIKTVKLRGIEISSQAELKAIGEFFPTREEKPSSAKAQSSKEESQEGEFMHTYGIKDWVLGDKDGSIKYKYEIKNLEDGVFQNLCLETAEKLAREIDFKLKQLYAIQKRKEKKSKK